MGDTVTLTAEPLTIGALGASVVCPTAGGIASFIGTTRDSFNGKRVLRLEHILRSAHCALPDRAAMERSLTIIFSPSSSPTLRPNPPQYEAYEPMARTELLAICRQMRERWPLRHIAIAHRTGVVPLAEASVEIAVSATQRTEALAAVQFAIDELKARVPIWKREVYMAQGEGAVSGSAWKVNRECAFPAAHK